MSSSGSTLVYGAACNWFDSLDQASTKATWLPCCPHCGGVLFVIDASEWWENVDRHEAKSEPGYRAKIEWMRGQCFKTMTEADAAYAAHLRGVS